MGYGIVGSYRSPASPPVEIPHAPVHSPGGTYMTPVTSLKVCSHTGIVEEKINAALF